MSAQPKPSRRPPAWPDAGEAARAAGAVLLLAAVLWLLGWVAHRLLVVIVPIAVALFATAVLRPLQVALHRRGVQRTLATFLVLLGVLFVVAAVLWFVVPAVAAEVPQLRDAVTGALREVRTWLRRGPLDLAAGQIERLERGIVAALPPSTGGGAANGVASAAVSGAKIAFAILAAVAFTLFLTFFFVRDGQRLWDWLVAHVPARFRAPLDAGGSAAWETLARYLRALVVLAAFNAVATAVVLLILGVPLVFPLAIVEFVLSFIPLIGALTAGALAALVTLATNGPVDALIVVAMAIVIEQVEGNVIEPLIVSHAVDLHPVVVATLVAVGSVFFGIVGAFLAVPLAAMLSSAVPAARAVALTDGAPSGRPPPQTPE